MKKTIKIVSLLLMMVMLNGCMKLNVDCGIDKNHTAYLNYTIEMNMKELDNNLKKEIVLYFENLVDGYEEYGFKYINRSTDDQIDITLTYEKTASNYEEAYDNLKDILNDPEVSFLLSTDMTTEVKEYEQGFTFYANTDISKILGTSYFETFPKNVNNIISEGIQNSEVNFFLTLPQSTIVETNGDIKNKSGYTTITFPVSLAEASEFNVIARMSIDDNKAIKGDINSLIQKNQKTISLLKSLRIVVSILAGCLSIVLVSLIIKQRKNKRLKQ